MNEDIDESQIDYESILDGIDFSAPSKETPVKEIKKDYNPFSKDAYKAYSTMDLRKQAEKTRKWLQKNYPPKPKEPRQLKEDPDSGTFT
jgi:hypothetical protein